MKKLITLLNLLVLIIIGGSAVEAQETKIQKEFRPISIIDDIDKPEGMAVIGNILYISQYHENGSIIKYDIANKMVLGKVIQGLNYPTGLLAFNDQLIVLEYGTGSMFLVDPKNGQKELMASDFSRPADVILFNDKLLVSDFGRGIIYAVDPNSNNKSVYAAGVSTPAGLAVFNDEVHVVEWGMGRISKIKKDGSKEYLITEGLSSPWGLMVYNNELYVAENGSNEISKVISVKIPIKNNTKMGLEESMNAFQDSMVVWKTTSMNCSGLNHPEAFSVSERGIYVSEWKSKEVSEILLNSPPSGTLLLAGKSKLGNVLTAEPQNIQDEDGLGPFSYRWEIAENPEAKVWEVVEQNKLDYKLKKESLAGKYIRAVLSYTDQKGFKEFVFSNAEIITQPFAPEVALSFYPDKILKPGDTLTLIANLSILDEDAQPDKVEFYSDGLPLISVLAAPYTYRFIVQDSIHSEAYLNQLSIVAKGYDTNGLFGQDEKSVYVTNEDFWEAELQTLLISSEKEINMFPNPAKNVLNLVYQGDDVVKIRLFNMNKMVVLTDIITNQFKALDVSKLTPGTYILEYTIGSETKAAQFIKL
jgi:hypothetical protein